MPETHNPNLHDKHSSSMFGIFRFALVFVIAAILLLFGRQIVNHFDGNSFTAPTSLPHLHPSLVESPTRAHTQSPFGWLTFIADPLYLALRILYTHGIHNWGWAIVLLTTLFNALMIWPRILSLKSSLKMMRIKPRVDAIKQRAGNLNFNDPKRLALNNEISALYKSEGASIFGGCLPMLLQMPLLFAFQSVLHNAIELHHAHWLWLTDLSLPDPLHILPILIIASMCITQLITPNPGMDPAQRRILAILMPLIIGFTLWRYGSGMALYWVTCNLFNLTLQLSINRTRMGKEIRAIPANQAIR